MGVLTKYRIVNLLAEHLRHLALVGIIQRPGMVELTAVLEGPSKWLIFNFYKMQQRLENSTVI